ncbi:MAG: ABC-type Fe3+/spermidine/putrescine transport system ATPase subunit [Salibacteraceae bacterium]|jgi:ABC-type Fe3+/spermidine/putrescine transport system ATPase subunit
MFLRLKRVEKSFSSNKITKALKPLSISIEKGQHIFIIGETGSGKSTLLRCLAGMYDIDGGEIIIEGKSVGGPAVNLIPGHKDIRLVEQDFSLKKFNTIYQNLEMAVDPTVLVKERSKRIKKMLDLFGLNRMKNKLSTELSGGQQQRLALAVALIELPKLLLLDEPFSHFDPQLKSRIFQYLKIQIKEQKVTVVTVTHDFRETLKHADKVLVLNKGKKLQYEKVDVIYHQPKDIYTAGLLGEFNVITFTESKWLVRPEELSFSDTKTIQKVKIESIEFCGYYFEVVVTNKSGDQLVVFESNTDALELGAEVYLNPTELTRKLDTKENLVYGESFERRVEVVSGIRN